MIDGSGALAVAAPAKVNLFLNIVGRRSDGYHLLESLFVLIDWCDTITLSRRADAEIVRVGDVADVSEADDLAVRAACALREATGFGDGVTIEMCKRIPQGAGLGGGSSDAASVLLALNRLWSLRLPRSELAAIGAQLGAPAKLCRARSEREAGEPAGFDSQHHGDLDAIGRGQGIKLNPLGMLSGPFLGDGEGR